MSKETTHNGANTPPIWQRSCGERDRAAREVGRVFQAFEEPFAALARLFGGIELPGQAQKPSLQVRDAHVFGLQVNIEQGTKFPGLVAEQTAF